MINYYINKEKGIVVAKFDDERADLNQTVEEARLSTWNHYLYSCINKLINKLMSNPSVGKAVCSKEDTFDEEVGKEVAKNKLLLQYNKKLEKLYDYALAQIELQRKKICKKQLHAVKKQLSIHQFLYNIHE